MKDVIEPEEETSGQPKGMSTGFKGQNSERGRNRPSQTKDKERNETINHEPQKRNNGIQWQSWH